MLVPQPPSIITTDRSCGAWFVIPLNAESQKNEPCFTMQNILAVLCTGE